MLQTLVRLCSAMMQTTLSPDGSCTVVLSNLGVAPPNATASASLKDASCAASCAFACPSPWSTLSTSPVTPTACSASRILMFRALRSNAPLFPTEQVLPQRCVVRQRTVKTATPCDQIELGGWHGQGCQGCPMA